MSNGPSPESLCDECNTIDFELLQFTWPIPEWIPEAEARSYESYPSYDFGSLSGILDKAKTCIFCSVIADAFNKWSIQQDDDSVEALGNKRHAKHA